MRVPFLEALCVMQMCILISSVLKTCYCQCADTVQLCDQELDFGKEAHISGWKCGSWQDLGHRDSGYIPS